MMPSRVSTQRPRVDWTTWPGLRPGRRRSRLSTEHLRDCPAQTAHHPEVRGALVVSCPCQVHLKNDATRLGNLRRAIRPLDGERPLGPLCFQDSHPTPIVPCEASNILKVEILGSQLNAVDARLVVILGRLAPDACGRVHCRVPPINEEAAPH